MLPLCHTARSAPKSLLQGGRLWDQRTTAGVVAELRNIQQEKNKNRGTDVDLIADSAKTKKIVADATQVDGRTNHPLGRIQKHGRNFKTKKKKAGKITRHVENCVL